MFLDPPIRLLSKPGGKEKMFQQFGEPTPNDPVVRPLKGMSRKQLLEGAIGVRPFYEKLAALTEQCPLGVEKNKEKDRQMAGRSLPEGADAAPSRK